MERLPFARRVAPTPLAGGLRESDRGDVVLSWLTKLAVFFGLAGIVLFDVISVGVTYSGVADQGSHAAREASETWDATKDLQKAYLAASAVAADANSLNEVDPTTFRVDADGRVHLTISRTATTMVLHRIGPIEHLGEVDVEATGRSVG
jgi:hypothetical protein